jgi:hypothetical protein
MIFYPSFNRWLLATFIALLTVACSPTGDEQVSEVSPPLNLPTLEVYKRASCRCCGKWVTHVRERGFQVTTFNRNDLSALKSEKGIKALYHSCHTGVSKEGYVFEGHIPAKFIQQFLKEKPEGAIGLAVPAMPQGSPGMEVGNKFSPYKILLLRTDGTAQTYAQVNTKKEQY